MSSHLASENCLLILFTRGGNKARPDSRSIVRDPIYRWEEQPSYITKVMCYIKCEKEDKLNLPETPSLETDSIFGSKDQAFVLLSYIPNDSASHSRINL
jgi:hypothetical protein